jgi:hypothetical protein
MGRFSVVYQLEYIPDTVDLRLDKVDAKLMDQTNASKPLMRGSSKLDADMGRRD